MSNKLSCPKCSSTNTYRNGTRKKKDGTKNYKIVCKNCNTNFTIKDNGDQRIKDYNFTYSGENTGIKFDIQDNDNEKTINIETSKPISTIEDLLKNTKIDLDEWIVNNSKVTSWSVPYRNSEDELVHKQMYSVNCSLKKKRPDKQVIPVIHAVKFPHIVPKENRFLKKNKIKKTLVFGDMQVGFNRNILTGELTPFHDRKAIDTIFKVCKEEQPEEMVLIGDNLDFTEMSRYPKKPEYYFTMQPAINEYGWILSEMCKIVDGRTLVDFFAEEIAAPLHLPALKYGFAERNHQSLAFSYWLGKEGLSHFMVGVLQRNMKIIQRSVEGITA